MEKKSPHRPKLVRLEDGQYYAPDLTKLKVSILNLKSEMLLMKEHIFLMAELTRIRYNALLNEGFSEKQAIELSKTLF